MMTKTKIGEKTKTKTKIRPRRREQARARAFGHLKGRTREGVKKHP